jgi:hypothetical protein
VPGHLALREGKIKKKTGAFPECLGTWHSGKGKLKKKPGAFPECQVTRHSGKRFKKRILPRVLHSGKRFKKKEISSPSVALGEE